MPRKAIIIGAGPAGLTAAYELLRRTDIKPIILEKSGDIGGISKTINYKGNRMDIGGHRFFSKSDRVMNWWLNIMPIEKTNEETIAINYQNKTKFINTSSSKDLGETTNPGLVMLVRKRLSRIYFLRKFFSYPIQLSFDTLRKLGFVTTIRILFSYLVAQLVPRKPEKSLEDFFINRFGNQLYLLFFKDYTEKVWGIDCKKISAEWGAQRIKGVSISKAIQHAAQTLLKKKSDSKDISQKGTETSLIEQFLYPALGPGQLWEEVARQIEIMGGTILMHQDVKEIKIANNKVTGVVAVNSETGETSEHAGEYFFSTMPVQELIAGMNACACKLVPNDVKEVAAGLQYRDFITVGVLLERPSADEMKSGDFKPFDLKDTWIYIQEKDVKVGRLQLFNNWSPYMVKKPGTFWIGMEYFCNKGDEFWNLTDEEIKRTAIKELEKMGMADVETVIDSTVQRVEKTYPAYFGTYNQFDKIRAFVDGFENLFLVGRNGMHKYNNADHSMLTAMTAVDNIYQGVTSKENIWSINTEQEYHEERQQTINNEKTPAPLVELSFKRFVFQQQKKLLWTAIVLSVLQFIVFKFLYPYANFMTDSYAYLSGAIYNLQVNMWPIGYSKILRFINLFFSSDLVLVSFQYLILQSALFYFLFTLLYHLRPRKYVTAILFVFFSINPVFLCISNYILSDGIFTGLSIIWFTQLLWLLYKPSKRLIFSHALLLFFLFTIRYNALYYPIISFTVLLSLKTDLKVRLTSIAFSSLLIALFILNTQNENKKLTGKSIFSGFSGWMLANDALIMARNLNLKNDQPPSRFAELHKMVIHHNDSIRYLAKRPDSSLQIYYMWLENSPLQKYFSLKYKGDSTTPFYKKWTLTSVLYKDYSMYLIKKHPIDYAKNFVGLNFYWYMTSYPEFLGIYNLGRDSVSADAQNWFAYKSPRLKYANKEINIIYYYRNLFTGINIFTLIMAGAFVFSVYKRLHKKKQKALLLAFFTWVIGLGFSVLVAPATMRYQLFTIVVSLAFSLMIMDSLLQKPENPELQFQP